MPKIMKSMNRISRAQSVFRSKSLDSVCPHHYAFIYTICRMPGLSQDGIAKELYLNKSTVARALSSMEEAGLVRREAAPTDKRQTLVYPTDKMMEALPKIREVSDRWTELISEGVSKEDMEIFERVLSRLEENARKAIEGAD